MFWKKENESEKNIKQINEIIKKSFANVKKDTTNIFQWLNYFHKKNIEQEEMIKRLQLELSYMPKTREDIRRIIDDYYSFETLMAKIRDLNSRIDELASEQLKITHEISLAPQQHVKEGPAGIKTDLSSIEKRLEKLELRKSSIKEKIIKKLTRNSKEYVKSLILSYIKKYEKISAFQLKEIVVDEQSFCSKSSFYRLLEEVEQSDDIGVIKQGKEKVYFSKALKRV